MKKKLKRKGCVPRATKWCYLLVQAEIVVGKGEVREDEMVTAITCNFTSLLSQPSASHHDNIYEQEQKRSNRRGLAHSEKKRRIKDCTLS